MELKTLPLLLPALPCAFLCIPEVPLYTVLWYSSRFRERATYITPHGRRVYVADGTLSRPLYISGLPDTLFADTGAFFSFICIILSFHCIM